MTRLDTTRDRPAGSAVTTMPSSTEPPSRTPRARATGSAPAIASLTRSPSATGSSDGCSTPGVDPGQLEEVVDHPHHPVDLGADLAVVARRVVGHPVLERLGHRAQPGQRRAQVVGDPGDQLAPRLLEPLLAVARLGQPLAGPGQLVGERRELGRAAAARRRTRPLSPNRARVVAQRRATSATSAAPDAPARPATATSPADHGTPAATTSKSCVGEEHRAARCRRSPATTARDGDDRDQPVSCQRIERRPQQPQRHASPTQADARRPRRRRSGRSAAGRGHDAASQR